MSLSNLWSKINRMCVLINTTIKNKQQLYMNLSQSDNPVHSVVAQYLAINIQELSKISGDFDFVINSHNHDEAGSEKSQELLGKIVMLLGQTIDNKTELLLAARQKSPVNAVADLLQDNIQELDRIRVDLCESIALSVSST